MTMEFGVQIMNLDWPQLKDMAQTAEGLGFHTIMMPDHLVYEGPEHMTDAGHLSYDPMLRAAVVLEATRTVRVGHLVLCNLFRHPAVMAQSLTSLDHLGGGRLFCGIGTGWTASEFRMTGIPYPDMPTRLAMLDEALTVMRSLWTQERTTFAGAHYRFTDALLHPKPLQRPHPPILLGGGGKGLLRLAAKHADVVNIIAAVGAPGYIATAETAKLTDAAFRDKVAFVRAEAARHGRDGAAIRISNVAFTTMITDSAAATASACQALAGFFKIPPTAVPQSPLALVGTADAIAAEINRRAREWDVSQLVFSIQSTDQMERLAREVMPAVR